VITIGRGDGNTIILNSARISRNHARIEWSKDNFTIRDMSSSNGTFVNGQRIEYLPCALKDGDLIMLERIPVHFEVIKAVQPLVEQDASTLPTVPMVKHGKSVARPRIVITEGAESGREIALEGDEITIGRECPSASWQVQLKDGSASRPHARIEQQKGQYSITDLGSANGTTVNNIPVYAPVTLNEGDVIGIGVTKLTFHLMT
jgi:pSer/pThr/pTyr-binding forkhead associated (FHA) protein